MIRNLTIAGFTVVLAAMGQNPAVPPAEQATYTDLQSILTGFTDTVATQWNGQKEPGFLFGGELLYANSNSGLLLLSPNVPAKYNAELNALKSLGLQAVVVKMGYPLLYQPFLEFNGDPGDYAKIIAFYQQVVTDVHNAGLKVIVESASIFPGFFSQNSGLNVTGYYASIGYNDYLTGAAAVNNTIVTQIHPDYLNVGSENSTEVENTGFTQMATADGWAAAVQAYISTIPTPHAIPIGAGVGTWEETTGPAIVTALLPVVDYIDLHVYPINVPKGSSTSYATNTLDLINLAESGGKRVAISEAWLLKTSNAGTPTTAVADSVTNFSQDVFSFWAPLDQQFLNVMYDLSNWKGLMYFSGFWTRYYFAYLDYNSVGTVDAETLINGASQASTLAIDSNGVTSTGSFVKDLLLGSPNLATVSAASFGTSGVAPGSIVSLFGSNLATATVPLPDGAPLGDSLGGTSVSVTDSLGTTKAADLFFVSSLQVNALFPTGLVNGNASVTVTPGSGASVTGTVNIQTVSPGLFAENGTGAGVAGAQTLTIQSDGSSAYSNVFQGSGPFTPLPINVSASGTQVYLVLYGTGIAGRSSVDNVSVKVGGQTLPAQYAGSQNADEGLDQVNVLLPASLAGSGVVDVQVTVDGVTTNTVQIQVQ